MDKKLLELRKRIKAKKPKFARQDSHKLGLNPSWRKPNGIQSKMRMGIKGYNKLVSPGYGSPRAVFGLHPTGYKIALVSSLKDLERVDVKKEGIVISANVGMKTRVVIVTKAKEKNIKILNVKDADKFLKEAEEKMKMRKDAKKQRESDLKKKKEEKPVKKEEKKLESLTEKEKKDMEKQEKEKLLTKRDA